MSDIADRLAKALRACADDLGAQIDAGYGNTINTYPSQLRRWERDMEPVRAARALLDEYGAASK